MNSIECHILVQAFHIEIDFSVFLLRSHPPSDPHFLILVTPTTASLFAVPCLYDFVEFPTVVSCLVSFNTFLFFFSLCTMRIFFHFENLKFWHGRKKDRNKYALFIRIYIYIYIYIACLDIIREMSRSQCLSRNRIVIILTNLFWLT